MSLGHILLIPGIGRSGVKTKQTNTDGWPSIPANLRFARIIHTSRNLVEVRSSAEATGSPFIPTSEVVHPSIVAFNQAWNGYKYWMMITPYPGGSEGQENPSILATNDENLIAWEAPPGVLNPIQRRPVGVNPQGDPCLIYDPASNSLVCIYIRTVVSGSVRQTCLTQSFDGVTWSIPIVIITGTIESSPCLVTYKSGARKYRAIYKKVDTNPGTMHYREIGGDVMSAAAWGAATENNISLTIPSSRQVWDFQCWRLQSGDYLFLQTLTDSARVHYTNHWGVSTDGLASINYYHRPAWNPRIGSWPRDLAYTSSIVKTSSQSKAVISGSDAGPPQVWGQATCPLLEHPWRAMSSFPRDVSGQVASSHGQKLFTYTHSGTGNVTADNSAGMIVDAGKQLSGTVEGLSSIHYTVVCSFRVPTACNTVPNNTYVEICNVGGIRMGLKRHSNNTNWLLEFRRADTNAAIWQPVFLTSGQPQMKVAFCRGGSALYAQHDPHPFTGIGGVTNLTHTQTNDITIGSAANAYGFEIRQIEVLPDAGVQQSTGQRNMELLATDTFWPQTGIAPAKPTIAQHPSNVVAGSGTSFTCIPGAYPGCTLQWESAPPPPSGPLVWSDISGANSNIYPRNTITETGWKFRCRATNSAGSTVSDTATVI